MGDVTSYKYSKFHRLFPRCFGTGSDPIEIDVCMLSEIVFDDLGPLIVDRIMTLF